MPVQISLVGNLSWSNKLKHLVDTSRARFLELFGNSTQAGGASAIKATHLISVAKQLTSRVFPQPLSPISVAAGTQFVPGLCFL